MKEEQFKGEEWRPVKGYEGYYEVSNYGRVKSLPRYHRHYISGELITSYSGGIRAHNYDEYGYDSIMLKKNGTVKNKAVHRLVAEAFIPNPDNLPIINHKDENPSNNRVENLEWCTNQYNVTYGTAIERRVEKTIKPVYHVDRFDNTIIKKWDSMIEAERVGGFNGSAISRCCLGKSEGAQGFKWCYATDEDYKRVCDVFYMTAEDKKPVERIYSEIIKEERRKEKEEEKKLNPIKDIPVEQIDLKTGEVIKVWPCANVAAKELNFKSGGGIREVTRGRRKSCQGFGWRYANGVQPRKFNKTRSKSAS